MSADWQPIATAVRTDDENQAMIMLRQDGRRFIGEWDAAAGHWQGLIALDGVERERYFQEFPGRLYGVTEWAPLDRDDDDVRLALVEYLCRWKTDETVKRVVAEIKPTWEAMWTEGNEPIGHTLAELAWKPFALKNVTDGR